MGCVYRGECEVVEGKVDSEGRLGGGQVVELAQYHGK